MQVEYTYTVSAAFKDWLRAARPGVLKVIEDRKITQIEAVMYLDERMRPGRHLLTFSGLLANDPGFDRQVHTDDACIVLDDHPDSLGEQSRLGREWYRGRFAVGDRFWVEVGSLCRLTDTPLLVSVEVVERQQFFALVVLPDGNRVPIDVDDCGKYKMVWA